MLHRLIILFLLFLTPWVSEARMAQLAPLDVNQKFKEIMKSHATYKELNPILMKRILQIFLEELDPSKTYFISSDIQEWQEPSDEMLTKVLNEFQTGNFDTFYDIHKQLVKAIARRHVIDERIKDLPLPKHVNITEFKDMTWAPNEEILQDRILKIRALQLEAASKLTHEFKERSLQRIAKRQAKYEEEVLNPDPAKINAFILTHVLKAASSSLDTHTSYFTPDEASQFLINVQQRLFGIGVQLRDDINGFTVIKIIEGGPAANNKGLKVKDRIIAVNGEPVVGMDIIDAVELIRGEEATKVRLTIIRESGEEDDKKEEKIDVDIDRGEVVLKETRYETSIEPYGKGVIAYIRLHTFYQDPESSSAEDMAREFEKIKKEHNVIGFVLDLRDNSGGLLSQAVSVAGLFITKGIVVSIKDEAGKVQHLRDLDGLTLWDGPMIVLTNRTSASAAEIVAQALQDYGRALVVGDDHTFGKGTFQTFTLNAADNTLVNPQGEYKVTRGKYYTVSGKTPQLTGVIADIVVPGYFSETEIGEKFSKYPLENDKIKPNFEDDLSDVPFFKRFQLRELYHFNLQKRLDMYLPYLEQLIKNSELRIKENKNYQNLLTELKKKDKEDEEESLKFGENDLQLTETYNIMKDLILLMIEKHVSPAKAA